MSDFRTEETKLTYNGWVLDYELEESHGEITVHSEKPVNDMGPDWDPKYVKVEMIIKEVSE